MRILVILSLLVYTLYAQKILVLNSNASIEKYKSVQDGFVKSFKGEYELLDISHMSQKEVKRYLYDEYPDIIYTIGVKAYGYANMYLPEKTIFFSSIMNYKRLKLKQNRYGISNELHTGMHLTLIQSIFSKSKTLSIIYSEYTQDLYFNFKNTAALMNIKVIGQKIEEHYTIDSKLLENSDGLILIADPVLLRDETSVKAIFDDMRMLKKPVFAYHELFLELRASLVISAHHPTIGRQIASMMDAYINEEPVDTIQMPMGTKVIFNKRMVELFGLKYNNKALSVVDEVVE